MRFNENTLYDDKENAVIKTFRSKVPACRREYRAHHHTECELSVFIDGSGVYSVNDREYAFTAGDMFLFGSDETHCITDIYEEINLLNIHFEPRILWEHSENIELMNLFFSRNEHFSNKFISSDAVLKDIILNIEHEITQKETGYRIQAKYMLFSALVHILRTYNYADTDKSVFVNRTTMQRLKEAMIYIDNNLENKITLAQIADVACMAQAYFSTVFKKFNGISPWTYITIKRVENAINLIKTTDMTKLEIAEKCGFSSSSNFYKAFYRVTGKTPKDYSAGP